MTQISSNTGKTVLSTPVEEGRSRAPEKLTEKPTEKPPHGENTDPGSLGPAAGSIKPNGKSTSFAPCDAIAPGGGKGTGASPRGVATQPAAPAKSTKAAEGPDEIKVVQKKTLWERFKPSEGRIGVALLGMVMGASAGMAIGAIIGTFVFPGIGTAALGGLGLLIGLGVGYYMGDGANIENAAPPKITGGSDNFETINSNTSGNGGDSSDLSVKIQSNEPPTQILVTKNEPAGAQESQSERGIREGRAQAKHNAESKKVSSS